MAHNIERLDCAEDFWFTRQLKHYKEFLRKAMEAKMTIKAMVDAEEMYPVYYVPWVEGNKLDYTDALGYDATINEDSILSNIDVQLYNRYIQAKLEWEVVQQALRAIYVEKHGE